MTKKIVLFMLPALMLSGCTLLFNNNTSEAGINDELYKPTVKIGEDKKGEDITKEAADELLDQFTSRMSATIADLKSNTPDFVTYTFKTDVDDKYNFSSLNYAKEAKYAKAASDTFTPVTLDDGSKAQDKESHVVYDYLDVDRFVEAKKDSSFNAKTGETTELKTYKVLDAEKEFAWVDKAQEMGNKATDYLTKYREYLDREYKSADVTVKFSSKGEGHLYAYVNAPSLGATVELLFEDYFLSYGYAYLNLRGVSDFIPDQFKQYSCLATEIHVDFSSFTPEYPTLAEYTVQ